MDTLVKEQERKKRLQKEAAMRRAAEAKGIAERKANDSVAVEPIPPPPTLPHSTKGPIACIT